MAYPHSVPSHDMYDLLIQQMLEQIDLYVPGPEPVIDVPTITGEESPYIETAQTLATVQAVIVEEGGEEQGLVVASGLAVPSNVFDLARLLAWLFRDDITYNVDRRDVETDVSVVPVEEDC